MSRFILRVAWCRPDEGDTRMGDKKAKPAKPSRTGGKTGK
jgi:hypothetical protein